MHWFMSFLLFQLTYGAVINPLFDRHQPSNPLNFTISPLLIHDTKSVAHTSLIFGSAPGKLQDIRLCKCSEVKNCQQLGRAEVAFCQKKCQPHLDYFNKNHTEISSCFVETQELEILNNCLRKGVPDFCNEKKETELSTSSQTFVYNVDSTYSEFLSTPNVGLKRARRAYIQMRSYQNCFTSCAKKAEAQCLLSNGCRAFYPTENEIHRLINECDNLFPKALHSAVNSCDCLVEQKKCLKLTDVCSMLGNRFLMTVF